MLFIFPEPGIYKFWMKDMNFPIDIIWLDETYHVVYVKKNADPKLYPETYQSGSPAVWVIETVAGFTDLHNVRIGDYVKVVSYLR